MILFHLFTLIALLTVLPATAATPSAIDTLLADTLDQRVNDHEPGCVIAYGDGQRSHFFAKGLERVGHPAKLNADTRFLTASVTKQVTAHLALQLAKQGRLPLDGAVNSMLPPLSAKPPITIKQLMNHTSGIPDHWPLFELQGRALTDSYRQQTAASLLLKDDFLEFAPGSEFSYSNGGYLVLTELIERVAGQPLNTLAEKSLFAPLGINSYYLDQPLRAGRPSALVHGHQRADDGRFVYLEYDAYLYGPGNLAITAREFARWAGYLNDQLNSHPVYRAANAAPAQSNRYVAGLYIKQDGNGRRYFHHAGYYEHATQDIVLLPESGEFALALCNRADFRPARLTRQLLTVLGSLVPHPAPAAIPGTGPGLTSGLYANDRGTQASLIVEENDDLYYYGRLVGSPKKLKRLSNDTWGASLSDSRIRIMRLDNKRIRVSNDQQSQDFTRQPLSPSPSRPNGSKQRYRNALIGDVHLQLAEPTTVDFGAGIGAVPLQCTADLWCFSEEGYVIIKADRPGRITLSTRDVQNLPLYPVD